MKALRVNGLTSMFTPYAAILLMAMTVSPLLALAAYGQQEVDPSWYSPWGEPVHATQAQPANHLNHINSNIHRGKKHKQARRRVSDNAIFRRKLAPSNRSKCLPATREF